MDSKVVLEAATRAAIKAAVESALVRVEETKLRYENSETFERTPRYRAAVNELVDAIAALMPNLTFCATWQRDMYEDVFNALGERHPNFDRELNALTYVQAELRKRDEGTKKRRAPQK
jgi:hypothetical protein